MQSKVIAVLMVLCVLQSSESKALKPFWGANPFMAAVVDQSAIPVVSELQMRLNQAAAIAKSSIGMTVGIASKNVGLMTSTAKTNLKTTINSVENNPNATKDCVSLNKDAINQLNTESKNQLSFCSKSSQVQLKALQQVQKDLNLQASTLSSELNLAVNQCKLENPLPTDTAAVNDCVALKADELTEKVTNLEQNILQTVGAVETGISQILDEARNCSDFVQQQAQEQAGTIAEQQDQCSVTMAV